jgi:hypothetical protein
MEMRKRTLLHPVTDEQGFGEIEEGEGTGFEVETA